jgi:spoIIIJ-associated protein
MIMSNSIFVDNAKSYLEKMLAILDLEAAVLEEEIDENTICYRIDCQPDDARILIGRNGQTLEALQFVVRQMCRSSGSEQKPFLIDILDYRSRRQRSLEGQAKRAAVDVLNGDSEHIALPPMNAYERRLAHQFLQDNFPDLITQSEGEGPERHIVVSFRGAESGGGASLAQANSDSDAEESHQQTKNNIDSEETVH